MRSVVPALLVTTFLLAPGARAEPWPQFRGPNATGLAPDKHPLPDRLDADTLVWKTPLPPGHSSPVVYGGRIYVTALEGKRQLTIALDARTGNILWQREVPHKGLEKIHQIGSNAQPSAATDGDRVVTLFGSSGLFCYDREGSLLWQLPLGPFKNDFGAGSSPILVGDKVLLNQDHDTDSFLMALDKQTGKVLWKADRSEFPRGYSTPVIWEVAGKKQVVVPGTLRTVGYDLESGKEVWTVRELSRITNMTPVVGPDNILYLAAWAPGGDPDDRIEMPPFDEYLAKQDADKNGTLEAKEVPTGPIQQRFTQIDRDKDGHITKAEFENMRQIFSSAQNRVVAIRPGGQGDVTATHVIWSHKKPIPYVPSPLLIGGHLFMVKDGGIVAAVDALTGKLVKDGRVSGGSRYFSSPVGGDGKVYLLSEKGDLHVLKAQGQWEVIGLTRLGEDAFATPALSEGRIYVRTAKHLYCYGKK